MKTIRLAIAILSLPLMISCHTTKGTTATAVTPAAPTPALHNLEINGKVYAAVFQQRAAEYKALCQQAFNVATWQLDAALKQPHTKPLAIITDIDETLLDNSPYAVAMAQKGQTYNETTWLEWTSKGIAEPLMGSQAFYKYAASKGVEVFYITNRSINDKPGTIANLAKYNFPFADEAHVVVRGKISSKEARRLKVGETHDILLLLGDNLADFSTVFDKKPEVQRLEGVVNNAAEFGKRFIVLPNSGYGDWEAALFDYNFKWKPAQKDSIYMSKVKGF